LVVDRTNREGNRRPREKADKMKVLKRSR